jgi:hypothetical protein
MMMGFDVTWMLLLSMLELKWCALSLGGLSFHMDEICLVI